MKVNPPNGRLLLLCFPSTGVFMQMGDGGAESGGGFLARADFLCREIVRFLSARRTRWAAFAIEVF